jgi:magnesium-transporting ATPase (P-type)
MDERTPERRWTPLLWLGVGLAAMVAVAAIVARLWRQRLRTAEGPTALPEPLPYPVPLGQAPPGLTEEEAAARWARRLARGPEAQDNAVHLKPPRTRQQIWQESLYTIFNLSLVGLAFTQVLLGQWLSALLSLGTIFLNVGLNVGQEMLALRRLAAFQRAAKPKATVVREGKTRSVDPDRVVPGDVLIVGPGDQFLVDGQAVGTDRMVVDSSVATGRLGGHAVRAGDAVYAGSFCVSGRGRYIAEKVGDERLIVARIANAPVPAAELTPLEQIVDRVLRVLLVLVAVFAALLLSAYFRLDLGIPVDLFSDAASVIFNIAPAGLFLMIVVTYTTGTADLARLGALVHRARSVESLAEATVICFAEAGILAGTRMELEPAQQAGDAEPLPEPRLRQILGDYARSTSASNLVTRVLTNSFEGSQRAVREESPFLAAYGWSAIVFDESDLPGIYVLGEPAILQGHLMASTQEAEVKESRSPAMAVRRLVSPLGRLLRRGDQEATAKAGEEGLPEAAIEAGDTGTPADASGASEEAVKQGAEERQVFFRRWAGRVRGALRRTGRAPEQAEEAEVEASEEAVLLFAYRSQPVALHDAQGNAQLPEGLIPLCELRYARRLRPEAVEIVRAFARTGVDIKVFAADEPDQLVPLFRQAGLSTEENERLGGLGTVSGQELEQLSRANPSTPGANPSTPGANPSTAGAEWGRVAAENSIFGSITPAQAGELVRALRESGELVAVVGDGVTDLPALQQASLAIARQTSTQAALGVADIVMMGNAPRALLQVLYKGQGIVHGLLDVLKLNLTQVFYLALLIAAIQIASTGFPYVSAQGTAIVVITVAIPSVGLSFWATPGVVSGASFGRTLARFVAPAAVSMSLAGLLVYVYFLDRTGRVAYAQLALTYTLIYAGLLLAVFVKPPWSFRERDGVQKREWRMAGLALFLGVATYFLPWVPPAQKYLKLDWLQQPADYGVVGLVVVAWAVVLGIVWRLMGLRGTRGSRVNEGGRN